jgi:predicted permease
LDCREQRQIFSDVLAFTPTAVSLTRGDNTEPLFALVVSGNYFDVLGVKAARGRTFLADEDKTPGTHPVVVLSDSLWKRSFGADPGVVGKTVSINRQDFSVVGVAPDGFRGTDLGQGPDMWVPMMMHNVVQPGFDWYDTRRGLFLGMIGRLQPGVSIEQAQASLTGFAGHLAQTFPTDNDGRSIKAIPLLTARLDPDGSGQLKLASMVMMGVAALVLLIACANIANLLLARASGRRKEIAVRLAIGAKRGRLIRQLLTESMVISLLGGLLGSIVAFWSKDLIRSFGPFQGPNDPTGGGLDLRVLGFTLLLSVISGLLFGLAPALQASKPDLVLTLKGDILGKTRRAFSLNLRKVLVVVQIALSLVSLISAGLFVRSLRNAQTVSPGFRTENILLAGFNLGREGMEKAQGVNFQRQLVEQIAALPGVDAVTLASSRPFGGGFMRSVFLEGQAPGPNARGVLVQLNNVGLNYFETLGIPILQGRDLTAQDNENTTRVVLVNETMANRFWPGENPLGKRFKFFGDQMFTEVIGVVKNAKYNSLTENSTPFIFAPLLQNYSGNVNLHIRTQGDPSTLTPAVREVVKGLSPNVTVLGVQTLGERINQSLNGRRSQAQLFAIIGALALLLSSIGVYGVMAYSVSQRTREIGIRMALGAPKSNVLALVVKQGMTLVGSGVVLGVVAAFALTRLMASLLFGVAAADPMTFVTTALVLVAVAVIATYLPARRATKVDPLIALRYD